MRLFYTDERPSALPAAGCAHAHVDRVGHLTVEGVSPRWQSLTKQSVAFIQQFEQQKSVQLQVTQVRIDGTNGLTAKATGMAKSPFAGVDASGVPPRGRPV
jgi:hypothetical protein